MRLDTITQHRVHQYALKTGRSANSALAVLVQHGWDQYMGQAVDAAVAPAPTEAEVAEKGGRGLTVWLPNDAISALQAQARAERRSVSKLTKALLSEGIDRRKLAGINTKVDEAAH
jgi:hypothetical protein